MITVFLVSDVRLYLDGLSKSLSRHPTIEVVEAQDSVVGLLERLAAVAPDIVLLDTGVEGALPTVRAIEQRLPDLKVVALGVSEEPEAIVEVAEAGAAGYVLRRATLDELVATIHSTARGELRCSPTVAAALFHRVAALASSGPSVGGEVRLTRRELEVLDFVSAGASNKEVAASLSIELATVKNHVHNILEKLHVRSRADAVAILRTHQLDWRDEQIAAAQLR